MSERREDAFLYAWAAARGEPPARLISRVRGVVLRSAEGRIARSRAAGYLTETSGNRRRSHLTAKAFEEDE